MTQTARDPDPSAEPISGGEGCARDVVQVFAGVQESTAPSLAQRLGVRLGPTSTFASTEHFNLQTARSITVAEANGRASIYLAALSSNLIALAFIGQMSRLGAAFYAFALILLPVLVFVGVVTFLRLFSPLSRTSPSLTGSRACATSTYGSRLSSNPTSSPFGTAPARRRNERGRRQRHGS